MSYNPSAPPPSYEEALSNLSENTTTSSVQHNNQVPSDVIQQQQQLIRNAFETQPEEEPRQDRILVIQGGPLSLGPQPTRVQCPICHKSTLTRIEYQNSCVTHAVATMLCFMGCFCLAPVPYCVDNTKNAAHYCRKCSNHIGTDFSGGKICGFY